MRLPLPAAMTIEAIGSSVRCCALTLHSLHGMGTYLADLLKFTVLLIQFDDKTQAADKDKRPR
jgi:hypothetical protein